MSENKITIDGKHIINLTRDWVKINIGNGKVARLEPAGIMDAPTVKCDDREMLGSVGGGGRVLVYRESLTVDKMPEKQDDTYYIVPLDIAILSGRDDLLVINEKGTLTVIR